MNSMNLKKKTNTPIDHTVIGPDEAELHNWLFADLGSSILEDAVQEEAPSNDLFVIDPLPRGQEKQSDISMHAVSESKRSVWKDDDGDCVQVDLTAQNRTKKLRKTLDEDILSGKDYESRLRMQFETIYPKPTWLGPLVNGEDNQLFASTGSLIKKSQKILTPDKLLVTRVKDANQMAYSKVYYQDLFI